MIDVFLPEQLQFLSISHAPPFLSRNAYNQRCFFFFFNSTATIPISLFRTALRFLRFLPLSHYPRQHRRHAPFVALFVTMDGTPRVNEWFYKPARKYRGTSRAERLGSVQLAGALVGNAGRVEVVIDPVFRRKLLLLSFRPCFLPVHSIFELKLRGHCDKRSHRR